MLSRDQLKRTLLAATAVASLMIALAVNQGFGAPSDGLKKPPTAKLKDFEITTVAQGFDQPTSVDWTPEGVMLVAEREGRLMAVGASGVKSKLLDITDHVATQRERGLGTVEVAHDFSTSRKVYLSYTYLVNPSNRDGPQAMRVVSIKLYPDGSLVNAASPETVVLGKDARAPCPPASNTRDCPPSVNTTHQAGNVISDSDGSLWVSYGDSNLPSKPGKQTLRTYNPASTSGKILHVDGQGNGLPGHPFCRGDGNLSHTCTKVFARGFRNPFRFVLTPQGEPLVSDVGWNLREEISLAKPGRNYGWPCFEGDIRTPFYEELGPCRSLYGHRKQAKVTKPVLAYKNPTRGAGAAVIIGPYYSGGSYPPSFIGSFFFGDYAQGFIKRIAFTKRGVRIQPVALGVTPVDLDIAPDKNLAFVDYRRGAIRELVYSPANKAPVPQLTALPTSGQAPLGVSFTASGSSDPDGNPLFFDWDFGDGSAHSAALSPSHVYTVNGTYNVQLKVTDGNGGVTVARTTITVGNTAPSATILEPTAKTFSLGGKPVQLLANGSDPEDGPLPASAFKWSVTLRHKGHEHPEATETGAAAQFATVRDHDADSSYEVTLTVTDSQGLSTKMPPVVVKPSVVQLRVGSNLKGVKLSYGGRPVKAPSRFPAAIGYFANLSAPEQVTHKGREYRFGHWSQGGKRAQLYEIPARASRVRAIYK